MGYSFIEFIGAIIRWLIKGCKTSLKDEINGTLDPTWGKSYDFENLIIGLLVSSLFIILILGLISFNIL
jgi:hypothetical protein